MKRQKLGRITALASAAVLALVLMPTMAAAQDYSAIESNGNLHLRGYGNFFIPGTLATCPTVPPPGTNPYSPPDPVDELSLAPLGRQSQ